MLEDRGERAGELDGRITIAFVLDIPQSSAMHRQIGIRGAISN